VPNTAAITNPTTPFSGTTPRLMTDHTMRLRAALAAVNAIDMRDSDDDVTGKELNLGVTLNRGNDPINELETGISWATDRHVIARVKVFGHERQPFVTEVYAENDNLTNGPAPANAPNPNGYVAIELYNPYPVAINIRNCKLATIDRTPGDIHVRNLTVTDPVLVPAQAPHLADAKSNMATTTDQWTIPANGFLVLENYDGGGPATPNPLPAQPPALYRPLAVAPTGLTLPQVGLVPAPAVASAHPKNYTYVPNLHTVMDKEVVLLRPLSADYPTNLTIFGQANQAALRYTERPGATQVSLAVDMAPLDSYDFTGLANPDAAVLAVSKTPFLPTRADAWHYSRAWQASSLANETEAWRFVYPGRYDGHQTLLNPAIRMPRQQGTQVAAPAGAALPGWDPSNQQKNPWELGSPNPPSTPLDPPITLVDLPVTAVQGRSTYYPYEYAIQLTNTAGLLAGAAGPNPVVAATGNVFPFGAFARNGDILQIPYIGSYSIKLTAVAMPPQEVLRNVTTVATQVPDGGQADAAYHNVLELNSISMDSVFAEDGDPFNHFGVVTPATDRTTWPPEQVGRFTPTRMDLEEGGGGFVGGPPGAPNSPAPSLTVSTNPPQPPIPRFGTMNDPTRTETSGWDGFDIEIVDGPGKGQVRLVTGYSAGGAFQVFPDWEVQLQPHVSRYVLRRGSRWRYSDNTTMPPNSFRTIGNKYWASTLFDYLTVDSPQDAYFPAADPSSYVRTQLIGSMDPPLAVNPADPLKAPANTYGFMSSGGTGSLNGSNNLADQNTPYGYTGGYIQFLTGAAAGEVRKITNYTPNNRGITVAPAFTFVPVPGDRFRIFGLSSQDRVGTQGLVNINTAPWRVLAAIPWARTNDVPAGVNVRLVNNTIAQGIARYRDGDPAAGIAPHGPFRSIFDLYKVPEFSFYQNQILAGQDPTGQQGDFMPVATQVDNVRLDYEEQYLLLNRVSNMLTTRSDSFTVYVLVQGWRGAGTPTPELVVQRRRAFTADRSGLSPTNKDLTTQFFYND
jgi:hypothetical protein